MSLTQPATERSAARSGPLWLMIGPGLLLAATGVGSGALATGGIVGSLLGPAVLWAVVLGALLKFVVTEGLARWQLATGETLLEPAHGALEQRLSRGELPAREPLGYDELQQGAKHYGP